MAEERPTAVASGLGTLLGAGTLVRHWWAVMLRGVVAVLFGILVLASPAAGIGSLVAIYGIYALFSGGLAIAAALRAGQQHRSWGVMLLEGILGIAAGVIAFVWPGITLVVLTYIIGFWALAIGISELVAAFRLRKELQHEWLLGLDGVISTAFGIFAIVRPMFGAFAIATVLGIYALFFGFVLIGLGYRLGRLKSQLPARVET